MVKGAIGSLTLSSPSLRTHAYSLYGAVYGICGFLGPLLGTLLTSTASSGLYEHFPYLFVGTVMSVLGAFAFLLTWVGFKDEVSDAESDRDSNGDREECEGSDVGPDIVQTRDYTSLNDSDTPHALTDVTTLMRDEDRGFRETQLDAHSDLNIYVDDPTADSSHSTSSTATRMKQRTAAAGTDFYGVPRKSILPIILYALIALAHMLYAIAFPLFFASPLAQGSSLCFSLFSFTVKVVSHSRPLMQ